MIRNRLVLTLVILALAPCLGGCLKRTISITTEPEGAIVWLNDVEVGRTPLETDFTFYGRYDVRIRREGYEPIITNAKAETPIQELPGIDLFAEALPVRLSNVVHWHWVLTPVAENAGDKAAAESGLIERARGLRTEAVPVVGPTPPPPPAPEQPAPPPVPSDEPAEPKSSGG